MFVVIYQGSESTDGKWHVDTEKEEGKVATYEELETALARVKHIRQKGGEACLAVIIE